MLELLQRLFVRKQMGAAAEKNLIPERFTYFMYGFSWTMVKLY